ncbi:hypothetical protein HPP92_011495 [Vanilla planifolia]|uniref:Uncharacterized protein n=1 Tax=Vanilla planifolia TaxID=51239 RepID=A0A835V089_VANPL|nr:hypothetical protein HPP92_011495 [Vanilla planifolia]
MTRLSLEQISLENQDGELDQVSSIHLSYRALSDVSCLSKFQNLERLDLSYNCLTSLEDLSSCVSLKWLSVVENKLLTLKGVESLSKLMVLNVGKNKLQKMDEICALADLRALILNDNSISTICKLDQMKHLNTLVLSRNPIHDIGKSLMRITTIKKLSLSYCKLQTIGSALVSCVDLREARFAHNEITILPDELAKNSKLQTLDIGNNLLENVSDIEVLSQLPNLKNLNLLGNPIAEKERLAKKVRNMIPHLCVFNAKPTESSENRKHSIKESLHRRNTADVEPGKRKRANAAMISTVKEHTTPDYSDRTAAVLEKLTEKKSKSTSVLSAHKTSDKRSKKVTKESVEFDEIDDSEVPFEDLVFSSKATERDKAREKLGDTQLSGGVVVDHIKKKKGKKNEEPGMLAIQLLSSKHEVGLGGSSTWDS